MLVSAQVADGSDPGHERGYDAQLELPYLYTALAGAPSKTISAYENRLREKPEQADMTLFGRHWLEPSESLFADGKRCRANRCKRDLCQVLRPPLPCYSLHRCCLDGGSSSHTHDTDGKGLRGPEKFNSRSDEHDDTHGCTMLDVDLRLKEDLWACGGEGHY
ncbi:hypothetical protein BDW71DRAFT_185800 [Aspergillus fruticulosus]